MRRRFVPGVGTQQWNHLTELLFQVMNAPLEMFQFLLLPRDHVRHLLLCILEKGNPAFNVNQSFIVHRRIPPCFTPVLPMEGNSPPQPSRHAIGRPVEAGGRDEPLETQSGEQLKQGAVAEMPCRGVTTGLEHEDPDEAPEIPEPPVPDDGLVTAPAPVESAG
jgi:hypothetical protein